MMEYKQIWEELDQDKRLREHSDLIARLVSDKSILKIFFATEGYLGQRYLLIKLPNKWSIDKIENLPGWKGILIEQRSMKILEMKPSWYLVIRNNFNQIKNIFEAFIGSICEVLLELHDNLELHDTLVRSLSHWKTFFEEYGFEGLPISAQRGLYGELWFLRCLFTESISSKRKLVEIWKGPYRKTHDFSNEACAVEIKTSTAKKHHKFQISGEKQLDNRGLNNLYLVFLSFAELESNGESLVGIINDLIQNLNEFPEAEKMLKEKLLQAGYSDAHDYRYTTGFVNRDIRTFLVEDGFPRLLTENMPDGIGDLTYSVAVAACKQFEIPLNTAIKEILGEDNECQ